MDNRKIAILLSGRGSNFIALYEAIRRGDLNAEICCVVSNVTEAAGLSRAREFGMPAICLPSTGISRTDYDRALIDILHPFDPALICLAGFMRIVSPVLLNEYPGRVVNIHPALLPSFPGLHAQKQALDYGVKISGCTVHLADEGVDTGPILLQRAVEVRDDDDEETLSARILEQEHQIYWQAVALLLDKINKHAGNELEAVLH
ncbi:MAG TPA: phosphoribosylglycinamide formyltransferase [Acidobacteriota bacterium]|nr:phosphoribosylglycinamide formyltransferase [Acidobacteriota bacterium]